jgi:hypothetical protein
MTWADVKALLGLTMVIGGLATFAAAEPGDLREIDCPVAINCHGTSIAIDATYCATAKAAGNTWLAEGQFLKMKKATTGEILTVWNGCVLSGPTPTPTPP